MCFWGDHNIRFLDVALATCWMYHRTYYRVGYCGPNVNGIDNTVTLWNHLQNRRDLQSLLEAALGFDVTEPRDRMFGMLGLCDASQYHLRSKLDYSKGVSHAYTTATRACLYQSRSLRMLTHCMLSADRETHSSEDESFPSWVPGYDLWHTSYDNGPHRPPIYAQVAYRLLDVDSACGRYTLPRSSLASSPGPNILQIVGIVLGDAADLGTCISTYIEDNWAMLGLEVSRMWTLACKATWSIQTTPEESDQILAFARTLTCGLNADSSTVADEVRFREDFLDFIERCMLESYDVFRGLGALHEDLRQRPKNSNGDAMRFLDALAYSENLTFFRTSNGYMGMGPQGIHPSDKICILFGGKVPLS